MPSTRALPGGGREHAHEHLDRGALAGAVGADQPERAAPGDLQREIVDGQRAAEPLGQARQLDGRAVCRDGWS